MSAIAIVGLGCRYPDAASPAELWENVLAQRRAFRRIPDERLNMADYFSPDPHAPDRTYSTTAALIEDYEFDRVRYRVSGSAYRSADLAHWLALDIAARALADAGFPEAEGLPRECTAVYLGNTLTGEFSRAAALRLRWPFVRRVVSAALAAHGESEDARTALLDQIEESYKRPFAEVGEETLAGGLSNTIAGRISNHFDLKGGGFTVDGACASSLLAVSTACSALAAGDCDVALAGGVDLSLDPFELIGFAKAGALAPERMRVYDVRSAGFWPGEGCGFAVLMRQEDAAAMGRRPYAVIRGWGISSDGSGGITRPEAEGQLLAFRRAYRRAGFGADTVAYFEGHGTGTAVGDATELQVIARARAEAGAVAPAVVGSIKANIGHTKAAAGIAGLIKAAMSLHTQILPPTTGCESPHSAMGTALRIAREPESWPEGVPVRAAVSAMGFGGINSHVVMEGAAAERRGALAQRERVLAATPCEAELFLFRSEEQWRQTAEISAGLSMAELTDLAASLSHPGARRAVVASSAEELTRKLAAGWQPVAQARSPRIGFLFPGQGSQNSAAATEIAQPAIVRDSLAILRRLRELGIEASVAVGHSLGELTALCWAGVFDEDQAVRIAEMRGRFMAALTGPQGAMAGIGANEQETRELIGGEQVVIAALNAPRQTVISGENAAVERVAALARSRGINGTALAVSHAFHSPLVAPAAAPLAELLVSETMRAPARTVISTIAGRELTAADDIRSLLRDQITAPVRFHQAIAGAGVVDLWIEVGPGDVLSGLVAGAMNTASQFAQLEALAAAIELGAPVRVECLFEGRFSRPFRGRRNFFVNPCETVAPLAGPAVMPKPAKRAVAAAAPAVPAGALDTVRALVAQRAELPPSALADDSRLLADVHLNSIVVAQIATEAARRLGITPPSAPLDYAGLTIGEMARALESAGSNPVPKEPVLPDGVDAWVRGFRSRLIPRPAPRSYAAPGEGEWRFFGPSEGTLRPALEARRNQLPAGGGVILCLPSDPDERHAALLLEAGQAAMKLLPSARFVVVQHGGGAAALARTIHLEARDLPVAVVDLPLGLDDAADRAIAEAAAVRRFTEAHYDSAGVRYEPALSAIARQPAEFPLGPCDVLLVSGGAKGIGAECAIEAARLSGARLAILGTSPADHPEVAATLARIQAQGLRFEYHRADVTDASAVRAACGRIGSVTAILHCAGINRPRALESMEPAEFRRTIEVKTRGLRNLLDAAGDDLKLVVAFGSIIGHIGMQGEADYAVGNEWMARDLERWGAAHPECRCLTLEWSVWAGAGMGERVAHLEALRRSGVSPISIDEGLRAFQEALADSSRTATVVMTGRFGLPDTVRFDAPELPLLRFLERTRVHYPGVELVSEADLSAVGDPYLDDHVFAGARLLPGVMALEAMAQAATALAANDRDVTFEDVRFARPVIVPADGSLTVRLLALMRSDGAVEVRLRSADSGFRTDHFAAVCRFAARRASTPMLAGDTEAVHLDPERDLYGGLLFQEGRFRRLRGYRRLRATECIAEAAAEEARGWFSRYLPQRLVLGDPGIRDTAIHAIQACIPHARVLPGGARSIEFLGAAPPGPRRIHAREVRREGDLLVYNMEITTPAGAVLERWNRLELRIVSTSAPAPSTWPAALLAPYLERRVGEIVPRSRVGVVVGSNGNGNGNGNGKKLHRADGKPIANGIQISRAHAGKLTFTVTSSEAVGCDCEPVTPRPAATWRDLLGAGGFALAELVAREAREDLDRAATRVWCAMESMKKAGARQDMGIVLASPEEHQAAVAGWVLLGAGTSRIATLIAPVAGFSEPLAFAVLVGA